jgi:hypothetical protein
VGTARRAYCEDVSDTFSIDSSAGRLQVQFGWDGWVAVTVPRSNGVPHAARRIVESGGDLQELLLGFGLAEAEANRVAAALWRRRPGGATAEEFPDEPAFDRGLVLVLAALAALAGVVLLASTTGAL